MMEFSKIENLRYKLKSQIDHLENKITKSSQALMNAKKSMKKLDENISQLKIHEKNMEKMKND
jgi:predicted  nucleic acid-binding Zn-ribbon protein